MVLLEDKNSLSGLYPTDSKDQLTDPDEPILLSISKPETRRPKENEHWNHNPNSSA